LFLNTKFTFVFVFEIENEINVVPQIMLLFDMFDEPVSIAVKLKPRNITNKAFAIHIVFNVLSIFSHLLETVDNDTEDHVLSENVDDHPE